MVEPPAMQPFRAKVRNGRLVLDAPTDLPEGTVVDLEPVDTLGARHAEDRRALLQHIDRSLEDVRHGRVIPADLAIAELRRRLP